MFFFRRTWPGFLVTSKHLIQPSRRGKKNVNTSRRSWSKVFFLLARGIVSLVSSIIGQLVQYRKRGRSGKARETGQQGKSITQRYIYLWSSIHPSKGAREAQGNQAIRIIQTDHPLDTQTQKRSPFPYYLLYCSFALSNLTRPTTSHLNLLALAHAPPRALNPSSFAPYLSLVWI